MMKPDKVPLRSVWLAEKVTFHPEKAKGKYVLDGGALIYRLHLWKSVKFKEISEEYVSYVRKNNGNEYNVFSGYDEVISAKSNVYATRPNSKGSSHYVIVQEQNEASYSKKRFLSNNQLHSVITFSDQYLDPPGPCSHLFDFGNPLLKMFKTLYQPLLHHHPPLPNS